MSCPSECSLSNLLVYASITNNHEFLQLFTEILILKPCIGILEKHDFNSWLLDVETISMKVLRKTAILRKFYFSTSNIDCQSFLIASLTLIVGSQIVWNMLEWHTNLPIHWCSRIACWLSDQTCNRIFLSLAKTFDWDSAFKPRPLNV